VSIPTNSSQPLARPIYHLCRVADWSAGVDSGAYAGAANDAADGFIHCSPAELVAESAAKYHAGATDLMLLTIDPARVDGEVRWEKSRHGLDFPHIYGTVPLPAVLAAEAVPLGSDGIHRFPSDIAADLAAALSTLSPPSIP